MDFPVDTQNRAYDTPLCIASRQNDPNCGQIVRVSHIGLYWYELMHLCAAIDCRWCRAVFRLL